MQIASWCQTEFVGEGLFFGCSNLTEGPVYEHFSHQGGEKSGNRRTAVRFPPLLCMEDLGSINGNFEVEDDAKQ